MYSRQHVARSVSLLVVLIAGLALTEGPIALALDGTALIIKGGGGAGDLLRVDAATGAVTTLLSVPCQFPCFSPDGRQIAYQDSNRAMICIMNNDGTNIRDIYPGHTPSWTNDGHIMWGGSDGNPGKVYKVNILTGQFAVAQTFDDVGWLSICLDGTRGASTMTPAGVAHLHVRKFDIASGQSQDLGEGCQGTISPNGQLITHNQLDHHSCEIHSWDGSRHAWLTSPGPAWITHRFSHTSNDYIVWTAENTNPAHAYVCDIRSGTSYKIGEMGVPWDFYPGTLPSTGTGSVSITSTPSGEAYVGAPYSYHVTASGNPAPTFSVSGYPGWLAWDAGTSTLSGTPSAADVGTTGTITVTATSTAGSDSQQFQLVVSNVGPRIASIAPTTATEDVLYTYVILAAGDPAPSITVSGLPAWLTFNGSDTISGVPSISDVGTTETITVTVSNNAGTDTQQFVIAVLEAPSVEIESPAAGDVWYVGTTRHIEWSTVNISNVVVAYSTDDGGGYDVITQSISDTNLQWGMLPWVVVNHPSTQCIIRIAGYMGEGPKQSGTFEIRSVTDLDGDGMDDGWETVNFGDLLRSGSDDSDADSWSDYAEFMNGTDPTDPADSPMLPAVSGAGGGSGVSCAAGGSSGAPWASILAMALAFAWARRNEHRAASR